MAVVAYVIGSGLGHKAGKRILIGITIANDNIYIPPIVY